MARERSVRLFLAFHPRVDQELDATIFHLISTDVDRVADRSYISNLVANALVSPAYADDIVNGTIKCPCIHDLASKDGPSLDPPGRRVQLLDELG